MDIEAGPRNCPSVNRMIRVAAIADLHFSEKMRGLFAGHWAKLTGVADLFLLCGDLTNVGTVKEAHALLEELSGVKVPVVAVLGNHDFHSDSSEEVSRALADGGVSVLEGQAHVIHIRGESVGIAGVKGFIGGFGNARCAMFGEPEIKAIVSSTERAASALEAALRSLNADHRLAITHYAPTATTLVGEPIEMYPLLGASQLGDAIERGRAHIAFHGHAHHGCHIGQTLKGVPVRNVAMPMLRRPYALVGLETKSHEELAG